MRYAIIIVILLIIILSVSCAPDKNRDQFGRIYYIPGAGNLDSGYSVLKNSLPNYPGNIIRVSWTLSFNPAIDQTLGRFIARNKARELAKEIDVYLYSNPNASVSIIGMSAGTGIALWTCEYLRYYQVDKVILLSSSLSSDYDTSQAKEHIKTSIINYYSKEDKVLSGPVRIVGTIDGKFGDSAGLVGLSGAKNIRRYGGHFEVLNEAFFTNILVPVLR